MEEFGRSFKEEKYQAVLIRACVKYFSDINIINKRSTDVTYKVKFSKCLKITLIGFLKLCHCWLKEFFNIVSTRLNQDYLKNLKMEIISNME